MSDAIKQAVCDAASPDAGTAQRGCFAVAWTLEVDQSWRNLAQVRAAGAVKAVTTALRQHGELVKVVGVAALALSRLFAGQGLPPGTTVEPLIAALERHADNALAMKSVTAALCNFTCTIANASSSDPMVSSVTPLFRAGVFETMRDVMERHAGDAEIIERAAATFAYLVKFDEKNAVSLLISVDAVPLLVAALQRHGRNQEVSSFLCPTLLAIAMKRRSFEPEPGVVDALLAAIKRPFDVLHARVACQILQIITAKWASAVLQQRSDVVDVLVEALKRHADDPHFAGQACAVLRNLAGDDVARAAIQAREAKHGDVVPAAIAAMERHVVVVPPVLHLLQLIVDTEDYGAELCRRNKDVVPALLQAVKLGVDNADVAEIGCGALQNMLVSNAELAEPGCGALQNIKLVARNAAVIESFVQYGVVDVLLSVMARHAGDPAILVAACSVVAPLALLGAVTAAPLRQAGAVEAVVQALTRHVAHAGVCERASLALAALADGPQPLPLPARHDVVRALAAAMARHEADVVIVRWVCNALDSMALADARATYEEDGVMRLLQAALERHGGDADVGEVACRALVRLGRAGDDAVVSMREKGAVRWVCTVVERHGHDRRGCRQGMWALGVLAAAGDNRVPMRAEDGVVRVLCTGMLRLVEDVEIVTAVCLALRNLALAEGNTVLMCQEDGVVDVLLRAIARHPDDGIVVGSASRALSSLAGSRENRPMLRARGVVTALLDAAALFAGPASDLRDTLLSGRERDDFLSVAISIVAECMLRGGSPLAPDEGWAARRVLERVGVHAGGSQCELLRQMLWGSKSWW